MHVFSYSSFFIGYLAFRCIEYHGSFGIGSEGRPLRQSLGVGVTGTGKVYQYRTHLVAQRNAFFGSTGHLGAFHYIVKEEGDVAVVTGMVISIERRSLVRRQVDVYRGASIVATDGGLLDEPRLSVQEACKAILEYHFLEPSKIDSIPLQAFAQMRDAVEQAEVTSIQAKLQTAREKAASLTVVPSMKNTPDRDCPCVLN